MAQTRSASLRLRPAPIITNESNLAFLQFRDLSNLPQSKSPPMSSSSSFSSSSSSSASKRQNRRSSSISSSSSSKEGATSSPPKLSRTTPSLVTSPKLRQPNYSSSTRHAPYSTSARPRQPIVQSQSQQPPSTSSNYFYSGVGSNSYNSSESEVLMGANPSSEIMSQQVHQPQGVQPAPAQPAVGSSMGYYYAPYNAGTSYLSTYDH